MIATLVRRWWVFLVRGLCGIVVGAVAFTRPFATLLALIVLWGAIALSDGLTALWAGWSDRRGSQGLWPLLLSGVISLIAGVTAWLWPGLAAVVLLAIIAGSSIVRGLFEIFAAIRLRRVIKNEWFLATSGLLSLLFGLLLLARPGVGLVTVVYLIGGYAFISGILLVMVAFKLRGLRGRIDLTRA